MRTATRSKIDRATAALLALAEQLDMEPDGEEFQAEVERQREALIQAERDYFRQVMAR